LISLRNNDVNQLQYDITKIKNKIKELSILHDKHLNKPTLDDNLEEETAIDKLTQEITKVRAKFIFIV
jgi:syntaxin 16